MVNNKYVNDEQDDEELEEYSVSLKAIRRDRKKSNMKKMKVSGVGNRESQHIILEKSRQGINDV